MTVKNILLSLLMLLLMACSTQKNTWLSRNYNAMTARYNILHNGEQSMKRGVKQLQTSRQDNYMEVLPLFSYSGKEQENMVSGDMERAVEKGLKVIQKKSITARPKSTPKRGSARYESFVNKREFNPVVKEAYLLVGQAHLINHNFIDALSVLDYALREFPNEWVQFEILLWTARTRIEMNEFENARILLDQYDAIGKAPLKLYGEYSATYAALYIGLKQYKTAIPFVKAAAEESGNRWDRIRRYYILGQLYQLTDQSSLAMESFQKVIKLNPPYEMALNAGINYATTMAIATGNYSQARAELIKMAGQVKNEEYRDQLHYAIATSYLHEKDTANAILHLKLSAGYNYNNSHVKRETYIALASLYFDQTSYIPSYSYYDSTLNMASETDVRNKEILHRHSGLKNLTKELEVIEREDSLQWLASLPVKQREDFVDDIIEKERLAQLNRSLNMDGGYDDLDDPFFFQNQMQSSNSNAMGGDGKWYFYNPTTSSMGKMEFERKWGRRPLQDNWRRSDLSSAQPQMEMSDSPMQPSEPEVQMGMKISDPIQDPENGQASTSSLPDRTALLADIPTTPEKLSVSRDKEAEALFRAGLVFLQHFNSYEEAQRMFQRFIKEYPEHKLMEEVLFWNYMACTKAKNESCIHAMRQQLTDLFPNGHYAAYANDSTFGETQLAFMQEMNSKYEEAFGAYRVNNFAKVKKLTTEVKRRAEEPSLIRKSQLLGAMAEGKSGNNVAFEQELKFLSTEHPRSEEGRLATQWLSMISQGRQPVQETVLKNTEQKSTIDTAEITESIDSIPRSMFEYQPQAEHYLWVKTDKEIDINQMVFNIADYNFNRYLLTSYEIRIRNLPSKERVIVIGPFVNANEVMDYYYGLRSKTEVFKVENAEKVVLLAGSDKNRDLFISSGDIKGYQTFFSTYYLKSGGSTTIDLKYIEPEEVKSEETTVKPIASSIFNQDKMGKMAIEIPSNTDVRKVAGFITSQAISKMRLRVTVKQFPLQEDKVLIVVEEFPSEDGLKKFISELKNNSYWKTQLGAGDWSMVPVNQFNLDEIVKEGSISDYITWIKSLDQ